MAVDARGRTLVDFAGGAWPRGVQVVPFLEVWSAIEQGHADRIQTLANENAVLVVAEPTRATLRTPVGEMSPIAVQAHFARGLLAGSRLREASPVATAGVALALAALAAWVLSATRWWVGLAGAVVLAGAYAAALPMALATTGLVLPVVTPLGATALAALGGLVAGQLASGARIRRLEDENARVRETLVRNESAVESLEEDLDAARAVVARSTGAERDRALAAADPDRRRAGHGQGAVRARGPPSEPARGPAVRRRQHGRDPARAVRERAVRPRQGRLHGRRGRASRLLRAG